MNPYIITGVLAVLAIGLAFLFRTRRGGVILANIAEGTHKDSITKLTDAAITTRFLIYKKGSDDGHVAVAGASDVGLGTVADEASAAELPVSLLLFGKGPTKKMVASEAIGAGVKVYQAASGKVATSGTMFCGISISAAAADGDVLEVNDSVSSDQPIEVVTATNVILPSENGKTFFLSSATEFVSTLPAPAEGLKYSFIVSAAPSGASYTIVTTSGTGLIHGVAVSAADAGGSVDTTAGTPADTITFVDGQALKGDRVDVISDGTFWYAIGFCSDEDAITFTQS